VNERNVTGERIRELRKRNRETQEQLAETVNRDSSLTISRWEKGQNTPHPDCLELLAEHWNVPLEYLTGETDISDRVAFYEQRATAAQSAAEKRIAEEQAEQASMKTLFKKCGFQFDDLPLSAILDFAGVDGFISTPPDMEAASQGRQFRLSNLNDPDFPPAYFSSSELRVLLERLHDMIAFECFTQRQKCNQEKKAEV
jgi:transcriptional regulator with XRE-family HTH domain